MEAWLLRYEASLLLLFVSVRLRFEIFRIGFCFVIFEIWILIRLLEGRDSHWFLLGAMQLVQKR